MSTEGGLASLGYKVLISTTSRLVREYRGGKVRVTDLTSGESWLVAAGGLYQVGPNDRHHFEVLEDDEHVSVFRPPLRGDEQHDADGALEPGGPVPPGPPGY